MSPAPLTAREANLIGCRLCHLLIPMPKEPGHCPRCGARLHQRQPNSIARSWALLIAAMILYLPANLLPITISSSLGTSQSDTILSGVLYLLNSGSWAIALVIFVASLFVPLMKMVILVFLLVSVHRRSRWRPKDRTRLYRLTELVGRWSMVDIYVVTIMVALVRLGALANVDAGPGAAYFAAVVILTMFAAESFDPRLIWDRMEDCDE
ncbi:paraquat-inducible protein A [Desulfuromonas soudanensis]|uniref:Paraquat-inducible protein A n=1 Tax=Desulfuromonas soudanensis TaxID=1603606 RepID=A0A0M4D410_9BACT|nr:paraquat-inducible protein A [Desulfuromonas soudanensis]ALC15247.1 paraquat-inducible protein A [Desulfuromonas soudanensis]